MRRTVREVFVLFFTTALLLGVQGKLFAQDPTVIEKTKMLIIEREMDPVVLTGKDIKDLLGKSIKNIRVFTHREENIQPIPFQIDEKNKKGIYCYTGGEILISDEDPSLDENDELVLLMTDLGNKVKPQECFNGANTILEIEIADPLTSEKGWAYIAYYNSNPPRKSEKDYCKYIHVPGKGGYDIKESSYVRWYYPWGRSMPSEISVPVSAGGNNKNFIDTFKFRFKVKLFFSALTLQFDEDNMITKTDSFIDGPVRIVRKVETAMKIGYGLKTPGVVMVYLYYPHWCEVPAELRIPVSPKYFCSQVTARTGMDYNENAIGCMIYNSENPKGALVDGKMSTEELSWNTTPDKWRLITGPVGTFFVRALVLEGSEGIEVKTLYNDDITYTGAPPEVVPGEIGHLHQWYDFTNMKAGTFSMRWDFCFPPHFRYPTDLAKALNTRDRPVEVKVSRK